METRSDSGSGIFLQIVVGVAILAGVALVLLPMFARDVDPARKSTCLNNLKQCAQVLKLYCDDYNGAMPSSGVYTPSVSADAFCCRLTAGGTYPPTTIKRAWPQMLYDNMRRTDIVFCPSDSNTLGKNNNVVSYWYKYANDRAWTDPTVKKRRMADYLYEADQLAFFEINGWHFADTGGIKPEKQYNVAFIDTHVETIVMPPTLQTAPGKPACGPPSPNGYRTAGVQPFHRSCEPWFYNCRMDAKGGYKMDKGPTTTRHNPSTDLDAF